MQGFLTQSYTRFNNKCDFDMYLYSVPDRVNFIICNIISIYLGSNFVFDLIYLHTALDILYTSFSSFKYVYFFLIIITTTFSNHTS